MCLRICIHCGVYTNNALAPTVILTHYCELVDGFYQRAILFPFQLVHMPVTKAKFISEQKTKKSWILHAGDS